MLTVSVDNLTKEWNETRDIIKAVWAYTAGMLDGWAARLEVAKYDERIQIYKDMREFAALLRKKGGVTIADL